MSVPVSNIYVRFSNTAIDYTGFGMNVANVNCNENASIMKLNVNGNTVFRINMDGILTTQPETIWVPGRSMIPSFTNGCGMFFTETPTSRLNKIGMRFGPNSETSSQFDVLMPSSWNKGNIYYRLVFSPFANGSAASTNTIVWRVQAAAVSNEDNFDPVLTSSSYVSVEAPFSVNTYITTANSPLKVDGEPQTNDLIMFKVFRDAANVYDTHTQSADLHGIQLIFNVFNEP